jgi:hypothetical protein
MYSCAVNALPRQKQAAATVVKVVTAVLQSRSQAHVHLTSDQGSNHALLTFDLPLQEVRLDMSSLTCAACARTACTAQHRHPGAFWHKSWPWWLGFQITHQEMYKTSDADAPQCSSIQLAAASAAFCRATK